MHVTLAAVAAMTVLGASVTMTQTRNLYYSPGRPGPGLLLLHQCNMDRKAWVSTSRT